MATGDKLVTLDGLKAAYDAAGNALKEFERGNQYVPSSIILGYLNTNGEIATTGGTATKRATFNEYVQMAFPCYLHVDSGYAMTYCTYNGNNEKLSRTNYVGPNKVFIPTGTRFRATVYKSDETVITDINAIAKHLHITGVPAGITIPLTSADDANDLTSPGVYATSSVPSNWPSDANGILICIETSFGSLYQCVITNGMRFFARTYTASVQTWIAWKEYADEADVNNALMPAQSATVTSSTYAQDLPDANTAPAGRSYLISSNITSQMIANLPEYGYFGVLVTFSGLRDGSHGRIQVFGNKNGGLWYRVESGSGTTYNYTSWIKAAKQSDLQSAVTDIAALKDRMDEAETTQPLSAKIFKRVGCIGDSYTEGYINAGGEVQHRNDCAWPHYMEQLTGNVWTNFGCGGSSTKSWIDNTDPKYSRLNEVQAAGNKCQAYVIGLMINDSSSDTSNPRRVPVGTSADIGTTANSYYAYYYRLIQAVHAVNEDAPIFCNTCPKSDSRYTDYNQAVRDIVDYCRDINLPVYLCDLAGETYFTEQYYAHPVYTSDNINGHYTSIGYQMMAECYMRVLSDIIVANNAAFQTVHMIGYDEVQPPDGLAEHVAEELKSRNLWNPAATVIGQLNSSTGALDTTSSDSVTSDFIPVRKGDTLYLMMRNQYGGVESVTPSTGNIGILCVYNARKLFIRGFYASAYVNPYTIADTDAAYVRVGISKTNWDQDRTYGLFAQLVTRETFDDYRDEYAVKDTTVVPQIDAKANAILRAVDSPTSPAVISDGADGMPMSRFIIKINRDQPGSGDPSPSNVRPITGRTGAVITQTGDGGTPTKKYYVGWDATAGAVYGKVDLATGQLISEQYYVHTCTGTEDVILASSGLMLISNSGNSWMYYFDINGEDATKTPAPFCSHYKGVTYVPGADLPLNCCMMYQGANGKTFAIRTEYDDPDDFKAYLAAQYANGTPVVFGNEVISSAPKTAYQIEPTDIRTILGVNRFSANCGPILGLTYAADTKTYIDDGLHNGLVENVSGTTPSITGVAGTRYVCGEVATLSVTPPASGVIDVIFESGSTPTLLTVTPPSGMTMKWPSWFDPTSLEANVTYELNIMNGKLGAVMAWT